MELQPEKLAPIAEKAILEAIRLGLPVYYKKLVRGAFLLRRDNGGKGVLFTSYIPGDSETDPEGTIYVTLSSEPVTVWKAKVARIEPGKEPTIYPHGVVAAAAQYPTLFSTHEADVWYQRLYRIHTGDYHTVPPDTLPRGLLEAFKPTKVIHLPELGDYALFQGDNVVAWYNNFTGTVLNTRPYLLAAGLIRESAKA